MLPKLVASLNVLNATVAKLDLDRFVPKVDSLIDQVKAAQQLANIVDGSIENLLPKVGQLDASVRQAADYNRSVYSGLIAFSASFQTSTCLFVLVLMMRQN